LFWSFDLKIKKDILIKKKNKNKSMINLLNLKFLIYCTLIFLICLLAYIFYCLIKKNFFSKNIETITNNSTNIKTENISDSKGVLYRNILKISSIPVATSNGNTPTPTIHELKFQEIKTLYGPQIAEFRVTDTELWDVIRGFDAAALYANDINEIIVTIVSYIHT
jgi:hypothetical protein